MGSETEYPVKERGGSGAYKPWHNNLALLDFSQNGGRLYRDAGGIEAATPECTSPRQLTNYEFSMMSDLQRRIDERFPGFLVHKQDGIFSQKNNTVDRIDPGYHLNVHVRLSRQAIEKSNFFVRLFSHLVSAQVWAGTGMLGAQTSVIAPRCGRIGVEDKGRLPIAEVREEFGDACRVQVNIFGSNTSSYITWLKAGTTALVIRYLELAAKTSTVETSPCSGESQKLEGDLSAFASQETNNIDLRAHLIVEQQWHSLCHALFHQKLGLEWDEILKEWGRNINYTASEYDDHVSRRVEWRSIRGSADVPERHEGHYAAVNILRREYGCERSPILKHHAISPPSNTRAYLRGHAIRYWMEINKERIPPIHTPIDIHWGQLGVEGKDGTATFPTPNPFDSYKMRLPDVYDALRRALRDKINFFDELSST